MSGLKIFTVPKSGSPSSDLPDHAPAGAKVVLLSAHEAALARQETETRHLKSALELAQQLAVALEGYQVGRAAHDRLLEYSSDFELDAGTLSQSADALEAATRALSLAQVAFRKSKAPEVRDFSWYGGQVDVNVVREIVKLKKSGSI